MGAARDLTLRLRDLLRREHGALADFLLTLAAFDERRLWAELEYGSLFDFLHRELRLSKSAAFYRKTAVGLVREFPAVADALRDGKLCLMTVAEVARVLEPGNAADLLPRFFGLSKREAKVLVAPAGRGASAPGDRHAGARRAVLSGLRADHAPARARDDRRGRNSTGRTRAAVSHTHPKAGMAEILRLGLKALVERHAKRRGLVKRPRNTSRPSADPGYVPAHVSRAVWERDGGRCQWRLPSGEIRGSTHRVQIDHITPRAAGGPSTVENCRLACAGHDDLAARRFFGNELMDRYTGRGRFPRPERTGASASPGSGL